MYRENLTIKMKLDDPSMIAKCQETVDHHRRFISLILIKPTNNECCVLTVTFILCLLDRASL